MVHEGPINVKIPGRTDRLPIHVYSGSYVLPADIVSGLAEGNTDAGFEVIKRMIEEKRSKGGSVGLVNKYGIKGIVAPAGSMRDAEVIAKAEELGVALYFITSRHFKH